MKTRFWKLCLSISLCVGSMIGLSSQASAAAPSPSILLDGYPLAFPTPPVIVKGTTMVPFRAISEAMGVEVQWDGATETITAVQTNGQDRKTVKMTLKNPQITVNGQSSTLGMPATTKLPPIL